MGEKRDLKDRVAWLQARLDEESEQRARMQRLLFRLRSKVSEFVEPQDIGITFEGWVAHACRLMNNGGVPMGVCCAYKGSPECVH